jgi:hypothetical protein
MVCQSLRCRMMASSSRYLGVGIVESKKWILQENVAEVR